MKRPPARPRKQHRTTAWVGLLVGIMVAVAMGVRVTGPVVNPAQRIFDWVLLVAALVLTLVTALVLRRRSSSS